MRPARGCHPTEALYSPPAAGHGRALRLRVDVHPEAQLIATRLPAHVTSNNWKTSTRRNGPIRRTQDLGSCPRKNSSPHGLHS